MKQCPTCQEDFADKFGFCPVDGTSLNVSVPIVADLESYAAVSNPVSSNGNAFAFAAEDPTFDTEASTLNVEETISSQPVGEQPSAGSIG